MKNISPPTIRNPSQKLVIIHFRLLFERRLEVAGLVHRRHGSSSLFLETGLNLREKSNLVKQFY
jgi:hypothetical protein